MKKRIFAGVFLSSLAAIALVAALFVWASYSASAQRTRAELAGAAGALGKIALGDANLADLGAFARESGLRVTRIDENGNVLYENAADAARMENHLTRSEFQEAAASGAGESRRFSDTLGEEYFYRAIRLADGTLLRVAKSQRSATGILYDMRAPLAAGLALLLILSALCASSIARAILKPLLEIDLSRPEDGDAYEEIAPLLGRIAAQNRRIEAQIEEMDGRARRLSEITRGMREGLIVLDAEGRALSENESADALFKLGGKDARGKHLYEICRLDALRAAFNRAQGGRESAASLEIAGRRIEVSLSPVEKDGKITGFVLLAVDVTEKANAERMRREFTANVSHELRTPLTSISGYAELLKDGANRPEDAEKFANRIFGEAQRMIALIGDIMRLSKLDEGGEETPSETVELRALAATAAKAHEKQAEEKNVSIFIEGQPLSILTVRPLALEIVSNLIDNAIKYNREGGRVEIKIDRTEFWARVSVTDNGIGIPKEAREKVFERFYRVDKSRSKSTGGTGLGLSIVKHAALFLGATVEIGDGIDGGTRVTAAFPTGAKQLPTGDAKI